jgi:N-methylhydantoinase B/oxoprolinase/acetone carboxylase alpha subunit
MSDHEFAALSDLIRTPAFELPDDAVAADIRPVHAGLFGRQGHPLLVSSVGMLPSMRGALEAVRGFFGERWAPGDVALTNDMDAGAVNACEIIIITPVHSGTALMGWSVVRGRVPDFGGWEPGGYSPQAVDRWAEGARLEPVKVMARGAYRREVTDLLRLNSRTPATTLAHVQLLAHSAVKLGHAYSRDHDKLRDQIIALQKAEGSQVAAAFERLPAIFPSQRAEIVVPWSNERVGSIEVRVEKSAGKLQVTVSGPPIAARPINLGQFAAQDIVTAAIAYGCGLDGLVTDELPMRIEVSLRQPGLIAAPLPATVGLGRQTSGQALYRAIIAALGLSNERAEAYWQHYREAACGTGSDPLTGKLAIPNAERIRVRQQQEIAA